MTIAAAVWQAVVRALQLLTIALFAALVADVLWGVVSRFWPGIVPSDWTEELGIYLLAWVSLLGSALTYRDRGHLGLDYFVSQFDPAAHRIAAIVIELCVLVFAGYGLCYGGYRLVSDTLASGQLTPVLQWRIGYLYLSVPISGAFFVAFAIEHLVEPVRPASAEALAKS
ncbi:MAG: TRAP transporter small permease [Acidobacteria bacterium]|nr:MAG: TRAP transporter small permease [Acidobacteriota bacterium]